MHARGGHAPGPPSDKPGAAGRRGRRFPLLYRLTDESLAMLGGLSAPGGPRYWLLSESDFTFVSVSISLLGLVYSADDEDHTDSFSVFAGRHSMSECGELETILALSSGSSLLSCAQ